MEEQNDIVVPETTDTPVEQPEVVVPETTAELDKAKKEVAYWRRQAEKAKKTKETLPEDDDIILDVKALKLAEKKRQYQYENSLTPEQTDMIFRTNPNPTKKDLDNPFIQGGLSALKAKNRVEDNTPSSSGKSFSISGKSWSEMTADERKVNNDAYNRHLIEKNRQR
jgi:hypothetical protein